MTDSRENPFPPGKSWSTVYEYTHSYMRKRYGSSPGVEDAASDGFVATFDTWAKQPATKLGEWDASMAFAFAVRIARLKARTSLGKYVYREDLFLEDILSRDGANGQADSGYDPDDRMLQRVPALVDLESDPALLLESEATADVMRGIIEWCKQNPSQKRWMTEFLSGLTFAELGRQQQQSRGAALQRRSAGIAAIRVIFSEELESIL